MTYTLPSLPPSLPPGLGVALIHQGQYEEADKHLMQALREVSVKRRRAGGREGRSVRARGPCHILACTSHLTPPSLPPSLPPQDPDKSNADTLINLLATAQHLHKPQETVAKLLR